MQELFVFLGASPSDIDDMDFLLEGEGIWMAVSASSSDKFDEDISPSVEVQRWKVNEKENWNSRAMSIFGHSLDVFFAPTLLG